jgi:hypothetical protein
LAYIYFINYITKIGNNLLLEFLFKKNISSKLPQNFKECNPGEITRLGQQWLDRLVKTKPPTFAGRAGGFKMQNLRSSLLPDAPNRQSIVLAT